MADVIRDVIINLRIKQQDAKLTVPNLSDFKQLETTLAKVNTQLTNQGKVRQKNVFHERRFRSIARQERQALGRRIMQERQLGKEREKSAKARATAIRQQKQAAEATKKHQEALQKVNEESIKAAEGFRTAGEGAMTFARGGALLMAGTDQELQEIAKSLAIVQGGIDLFKGSIDIVKGLFEGTKALSAASKAGAAANTALAASNQAVAASGTAATASTAGLTAALGPLAIGVAAVSAAYVVYLAILKKRGAEEKKRREEAKAAFLTFRQEQILALQGARNTAAMAKAQVAIDRQQIRTTDELALAIGKRNAQQARANEVQNAALIARQAAIGEEEQDKAFERIQATIQRFAAEGRTGATIAGAEKLLQITRARKVENEQIQAAVNARVQAEREIVAAGRSKLELSKRELQTTRQALQAEKQRVETVEQSIHQLDPEKRARLREISGRAGRGEQLSDRDLAFARQFGGASQVIQDFVRREESRRGRTAAGAIVGGFAAGGGGAPLRGGGSELQRLGTVEQQQQQAVNQANQKLTELRAQSVRNQERMLNQLDELIEEQKEIDTRLNVLEFGKRQSDIQRRPSLF